MGGNVELGTPRKSLLGVLRLWEGSRGRLVKRQMIEKIQGPWGISHLGDEEMRPTGHTAESEAIATARPRVQEALAEAAWDGRVFNWWVPGLNQRG